MTDEELAQLLMRVHTALLASDLPNHMVDEYRPGLDQAAARLRELSRDGERLGLPQSGFYVQDTRSHVGNDMLFWRKEAKGYTTDLREAMVFTRAELAGLRDTDRPWPVEYINARWRPAVDFQKTDPAHPGAAIDQAMEKKG